MTIYVYETTIRVEVQMADDGEMDHDECPLKWASPEEQERSAREYAEQALPLTEDYTEEWVKIDAPDLKLVETRR